MRKAGEFGDQLIGNPIAEVFLLRITAEVGEWQNRNRRPVRLADCGVFRRWYRCRRSWRSERNVHCKYNRPRGDRQSRRRQHAGSICSGKRQPVLPESDSAVEPDPPYAYRLRDVLYSLCADILVNQHELFSDLPVDALGYADTAGLDDAL